MKTEYIDLLTLSGEIIRIECPGKFADVCYDTLEEAMKTRGWWSTARWEGCKATYIGTLISRVNMGLVVAML